MKQPLITLLKNLWSHINSHHRRNIGLLLVLMLLTSLAEIVSIGSVLPFLGVLSAPEEVFGYASLQPVIQAFGITEPVQMLLPLSIIFGVSVLISGAMRILLLWAGTRLSYAIGHDLSINIYQRTLHQPYNIHCSRNSSEIITGISTKIGEAINIVICINNIMISFIMLITIFFALMLIDATVAITLFGGFGFIYVIIILLTRKHLLAVGALIASESTHVIKTLQEGLGGIRDVLIDGAQDFYSEIYRNSDLPLRRAQGNKVIISTSPRFAVEALGMIFIVIIAYFITQQSEGIASAIPILGAFALGAQRLLPVLQQGYASWSIVRGSQSSLQDALKLLNQPMPNQNNQLPTLQIPFNHKITLNKVSFRYSVQTPYVLKQIDLSIEKGSSVGFIGTTGSGKSTLLDVIMGLLHPTSGNLEIDGQSITHANQRAWQDHIVHVPQAIFLTDSSIEENIAFGVHKNKIDRARVRYVAKLAQIDDTIENFTNQYQTSVGERGIQLSGGQRQRIGIARALYKKADIIIFDEATSALDSATEEAVMKAIKSYSEKLTLLIVAHRISTLKNCTHIIELNQGKIVRKCNYQDIVNELD